MKFDITEAIGFVALVLFCIYAWSNLGNVLECNLGVKNACERAEAYYTKERTSDQ